MKELRGSVASYLSESAKERPDQPALVSGAKKPVFRSLSFLELDRAVDSAVGELVKAGIRKGDKTLLFVNPGPGLIIWAFALFRMGAIPVVIDPGMGFRSFLKCIQRTRPSALVGISRSIWLSRLLPRTFSSVQKRYLVRSVHHGVSQNKPTASATQSSQPDDLAAIVFTSGSTGTPKGVRYLHRTFNAQIHALETEFGMQSGEVDLTTLPIFGLFNPALGITSVLPDIDPRRPASANPNSLVDSLLDFEVTTAFASPVIGKKVASACEARKARLSKMNRFFMAGAPVPPSLVERLQVRLPKGKILVPYGATEALPVSWASGDQIIQRQDSVLAGKGSYVGKIIPGARIKIVPAVRPPLPDYPKDYQGLKAGQVGEICASGPMVTAGYDRMPGATFDARFKIGTDPFHRMGDLGYLDEEGSLRFLGRKAECVITNIGPIETERCEPAINQLTSVNRCALIGLGSSSLQEPCLVIEPQREAIRMRGEQDVRKEILATCESLFPEFGIQRVFFEKKIPVDARHNAKIHRLSLAKKWTQRIARKPRLGRLK
jgi:acyl-CoA synthetase (AMP-forming)/AMP-acid ligase II